MDGAKRIIPPWTEKYGTFCQDGLAGGGIPVLVWGKDITEKQFMHDFVLPSRPYVVRNWYKSGNIESFTPLGDFCNLDYLEMKSGDRKVSVRTKSFSGEGGKPVFLGGQGMQEKTDFWDFLPELNEFDKKVKDAPSESKNSTAATVDSDPVLQKPKMARPIYLGKTILKTELQSWRRRLGSAMKRIVDPNISSGASFENLCLVVKGTKRFFLYLPTLRHEIYIPSN